MSSPSDDDSILVTDARFYAEAHGLLHTPNNFESPHLVHAPFALYPAPVYRSLYNQAVLLSIPLSKLIYNLSNDSSYLIEHLLRTSKADHFTQKLLDILKRTNHIQNNSNQFSRVSIVLNRYDYFIHCQPEKTTTIKEKYTLKQVEINTIAASFASLAGITSDMHRYLSNCKKNFIDQGELLENHPVDGIIRGFVMAHQYYMNVYECNNNNIEEVKTLMVVNPLEKNAIDQEGLRLKVINQGKVEMLRTTMIDLYKHGKINKQNGAFYFKGFHISVVYYRCGYDPNEYLSDIEWKGRELVEMSNAITCPTIAMQLAGTKRIQQVLTNQGQTELFVNDLNESQMIRNCFAKQWHLNDESVAMALKDPQHFVLKPQREGGGHNLFGNQLENALKKMDRQQWDGYTLMERLYPVKHRNTLVRNAVPEEGEVVSELGIYGVLISVDGKVMENYSPGSLVRTKFEKVEDGGIVAGNAVLDSARILDDDNMQTGEPQ